MARTYKIRKSVGGRTGAQQTVYRLTVPPNIAEKVPEDVEFSPELTEDGILFRAVAAAAPEPKLPSWAKRKR